MTPSADALAHYDTLLGPVYTWLAGGFEASSAASGDLFREWGIADWPKGVAVDLGCGSGFQSVPLADAGYAVLAIDQSKGLLDELRVQAAHRDIQIRCADLRGFRSFLTAAPQLIVCMGDTLPHLNSIADVQELLAGAAAALAPGGRLGLSFRDLGGEADGATRLIPVRREGDRLFTCTLVYGDARVTVTDSLYEKSEGAWHGRSSSYFKLRLNEAQITEAIRASGLIIERASTQSGLVRIVARKA